MHRFFLLVLLLTTAPLLHAHDKTPWGDPDLQGVWSNQTPTPLERPDALAGKTTLSEQEATEFEKTSLERLLTVFTREVPISGELNEIWLETAKGRVPPGRGTSLIVDPPNGKVPFTTEGQMRWDAVPKIGKPMLADGPEDRTQAERCITTDGLLVPNPFYNNYFEIVQAPGYVAIVTEMMHETRVIPLDTRPHVGSNVRMWSGDSRAWWEGETLVVETRNFPAETAPQRGSDKVVMTERFTAVSPDVVEWRVTFNDPTTWTRPWTYMMPLAKVEASKEVYEYACHEGNNAMRNILSAQRAADRAAGK